MMERIFVPSFQSKSPSLYIYPNFSIQSNQKTIFVGKPNDISFNDNFQKIAKCKRLLALQTSSCESGSTTQTGLENLPLSLQLQSISDESQFDRVIADAQQLEESVVILWMASWCRKCIYLKPKLEKLAAEYYPRIRFYSIDVNNVPHKLVVRAGVTKMPTIQLWRDGEKQSEVIGGTKAHLIINDVRQMIEDEDNM